MVTSIVPGNSGAHTLGVDNRYARPQPQERQHNPAADRVELTASSLNGARDSVRDGLSQIHQALALGHDAQAMLLKAQSIVRTGGETAQADLSTLLSGFAQRVNDAIQQGARIAAGETVDVQAEPGAAPVSVEGIDLRFGGAIEFSADAQIADPAFAAATQRSLETLQDAMSRLLDSARALEAHQGFLGAIQGAGVRHDLDADGARLLALQVRQGLEGVSGAAIANVEPQAVLSLFRA